MAIFLLLLSYNKIIDEWMWSSCCQEWIDIQLFVNCQKPWAISTVIGGWSHWFQEFTSLEPGHGCKSSLSNKELKAATVAYPETNTQALGARLRGGGAIWYNTPKDVKRAIKIKKMQTLYSITMVYTLTLQFAHFRNNFFFHFLLLIESDFYRIIINIPLS